MDAANRTNIRQNSADVRGKMTRINSAFVKIDPFPGCIEFLIDTSEFQRLRNIDSTPLEKRVYPGAENSYFNITFSLIENIDSVINALKRNGADISDVDANCLFMASLFKHTGVVPFQTVIKKCWDYMDLDEKQSKMSMAIVDRILNNRKYKLKAIDFIGKNEEEYNRNVIFIQELIDITVEITSIRPKEDETPEWKLKGRPIEKAFLYDILSPKKFNLPFLNKLICDAQSANIITELNRDNLHRLFSNSRVVIDENTRIKRIGHREKSKNEFLVIQRSIETLTDKFYQHNKMFGIEKKYCEIFNILTQHFYIPTSAGYRVPFNHIFDDIEAFLNTDDTILSEARRSNNHQLMDIKVLMEELNERNLWKTLSLDFSSIKQFRNDNNFEEAHQKEAIKSKLNRCLPSNFERSKIEIVFFDVQKYSIHKKLFIKNEMFEFPYGNYEVRVDDSEMENEPEREIKFKIVYNPLLSELEKRSLYQASENAFSRR